MRPNPISINRNATVRETAEILQEHGLHIAPVIDDAGRPTGVVSRTDLLDYWRHRRDRLAALAAGEINTASASECAVLPGDELTVREIMTPVVFGVRKNASIASIVEKMIALEVRCLFVTDSDGVLVGTISVFDVLRHLTRRDADHAFRETPTRTAYPNGRSVKIGLASPMPP
jgi:CBS domain-containing protein